MLRHPTFFHCSVISRRRLPFKPLSLQNPSSLQSIPHFSNSSLRLNSTFQHNDSQKRIKPQPQLSDSSSKAKFRTFSFAIALLSFSSAFYYLSQQNSFPFLQSNLNGNQKQSLKQHQYVTLPILSSDLSVSPSLSYLSRSDDAADPIGDSHHRLLRIQLNASQPDSLSQEQVRSLHPFLRIMSVCLKEPTLQIERAYTPLHDVFTGNPLPSKLFQNSSESFSPSLDLIIKRYQDGELSRYAHRLRPASDSDSLSNDEVINKAHVRGPVETWSWKGDDNPDEIILIVGGTGITPAYQLLTNIFGKPSSFPPNDTSRQSSLEVSPSSPNLAGFQKPKFTLLYSSPSIASLLLLPEISTIRKKSAEHVKVGLWVEDLSLKGSDSKVLNNESFVKFEDSSWSDAIKKLFSSQDSDDQSGQSSLALRKGRIGERELKDWVGLKSDFDGKKKRIILVCGPDGMISAIAGPKASDGKSQGSVGGILRGLGWSEEDVWKL